MLSHRGRGGGTPGSQSRRNWPVGIILFKSCHSMWYLVGIIIGDVVLVQSVESIGCANVKSAPLLLVRSGKSDEGTDLATKECHRCIPPPINPRQTKCMASRI